MAHKKKKAARSLGTLFDAAALQQLSEQEETASDHMQRYFKSLDVYASPITHHGRSLSQPRRIIETFEKEPEDDYAVRSLDAPYKPIGLSQEVGNASQEREDLTGSTFVEPSNITETNLQTEIVATPAGKRKRQTARKSISNFKKAKLDDVVKESKPSDISVMRQPLQPELMNAVKTASLNQNTKSRESKTSQIHVQVDEKGRELPTEKFANDGSEKQAKESTQLLSSHHIATPDSEALSHGISSSLKKRRPTGRRLGEKLSKKKLSELSEFSADENKRAEDMENQNRLSAEETNDMSQTLSSEKRDTGTPRQSKNITSSFYKGNHDLEMSHGQDNFVKESAIRRQSKVQFTENEDTPAKSMESNVSRSSTVRESSKRRKSVADVLQEEADWFIAYDVNTGVEEENYLKSVKSSRLRSSHSSSLLSDETLHKDELSSRSAKKERNILKTISEKNNSDLITADHEHDMTIKTKKKRKQTDIISRQNIAADETSSHPNIEQADVDEETAQREDTRTFSFVEPWLAGGKRMGTSNIVSPKSKRRSALDRKSYVLSPEHETTSPRRQLDKQNYKKSKNIKSVASTKELSKPSTSRSLPKDTQPEDHHPRKMANKARTKSNIATSSSVKPRQNKKQGRLSSDNYQTNAQLGKKQTTRPPSKKFTNKQSRLQDTSGFSEEIEESQRFGGTSMEDVHLYHQRFIRQQLDLLRNPIVFGGALKQRYEAKLRERSGDFNESSQSPLPEAVISMVIRKYNKRLLKHHHQNSEEVEDIEKKAVKVLDNLSRQPDISSKIFWRQFTRNLNFVLPPKLPLELNASREDCERYRKLVSETEKLNKERKQKRTTLKIMLNLVRELDKLRKLDDHFIAANSTISNGIALDHRDRLITAVRDARAITEMLTKDKSAESSDNDED